MSNSDDASERPDDGDGQPPRVFISYSDDSPAHAKRTLELAQWLRSHGVDATIDQFEESPEEGWPRWIYRQIRESEFVLVIATPGYLRRCEHDEPRVDASGSAVKFGSHLSMQELHEAGGRNKKFIPVLFGRDAIVESVPLPLRGATCYRLPEQRDDLYRRLTGQPKVQRAPLGVLKTFDDETLLDTAEEPASAMRGRASFDEQHAEDSFRAVIDAGLIDEPPPPDRTRTHPRRGPARRRRQQWITALALAAAFVSIGLLLVQRVREPEPVCHIQLTDDGGRVIEGIDRVDLQLPSGHLLEVAIEDGRTLRFACPPGPVQMQAHVYFDERKAITTDDPPIKTASGEYRIDGRVALPSVEAAAGDEVAKTQLIRVQPPRAKPDAPAPKPEPDPVRPQPAEPGLGIDVGGRPIEPAPREREP